MADGTCTKSGIDGCRLALNLSLVFTHGYHHHGNALVCRKQCPTAPFYYFRTVIDQMQQRWLAFVGDRRFPLKPPANLTRP